MVFLDYALAFGSGQLPELDENEVPAEFPPYLREHAPAEAIDEMVSRIETFPEATIRDIVQRVPIDFLEEAEGGRIVDRLLQRRGQVRAIFERELEGRDNA